jgi:hypothetical protein
VWRCVPQESPGAVQKSVAVARKNGVDEMASGHVTQLRFSFARRKKNSEARLT